MNPYFMLEIFITFIESFIGYKFIELFIEKKPKWYVGPGISLILTLLINVLNNFRLFSAYTTFVAIIFIAGAMTFKVKNEFINNLSAASFYYMCVYIIDFISISIMAVILQNKQFALYIISQHSVDRCIFLCMDKTLLFLLYLAVRKIMKKQTDFNVKYLFMISLLGFIGDFILIELTLMSTNLNMAVNWILFLALIVLLCLLFLIYRKYMQEKKNAEIISLRDDLFQANYTEVSERYSENAQIYHDMNNHVAVLSNLIQKAEYEAALAYIKKMGGSIAKVNNWTWTGDHSFDFILNYKRERAERNHIWCNINADPLQGNKLDMNVICIILANILDNAIEACSLMKEKEKWINIKVRKINELIIIKVENAIEEKPIFKKNKLVTSKKDSKMHGWGLQSVENIVKKEGGSISYQYDDDKFTVVITLF